MLRFAHKGYAYQDLMIALRLVDILIDSGVSAQVDKKLYTDDRFDDLTITGAYGFRERIQFKHRENAEPLEISSFTNDTRGLRLDSLIACAAADRDGYGKGANRCIYRILLRDSAPVDSALKLLLRSPVHDPGPFVPGMVSSRFSFDFDRLWPEISPKDANSRKLYDAFHFVRDGRVSRDDVRWFCTTAVVEVSAPPASLDLLQPREAELLLLRRVSEDLGAGIYPNENRSAEDVAAAAILAAVAARVGNDSVSADSLARQTQLRRDFGSIARAHPVDQEIEVSRPANIADIVATAERAATLAKQLVVSGPPGQGKSWTCFRVQQELRSQGWLVADHFCFLGDADSDRDGRVHSERIIGSILFQLASDDPTLVADQRPRFAAEKRNLEDALRRIVERGPSQRVAILVDGLDHVSRVLASKSGHSNASYQVAELLAALELPVNCVLMVFTQPGEHLRPFKDVNSLLVDMPGLDQVALTALSEKWGVHRLRAFSSASTEGSWGDLSSNGFSRFVEAMSRQSGGNALYATYICRELLRAGSQADDLSEVLTQLPPYDGSLAAYYNFLCGALHEGAWVADIVALLDFAVSRNELREMRPDIGNRIDSALDRLAPVLRERAMQGGIRVYHESFARFWLERMSGDESSKIARLTQVSEWLRSKGLYKDNRAYQFLLPTLARAERHEEVLKEVDAGFVVKSIAAGFGAAAIQSNIATAVRSAAQLDCWSVVVRFVELSRAAETYEYERLETMSVEFSDVPMRLLGPTVFASRLLHEGRTTLPARSGLKICAKIDIAGGVAPWSEYIHAFEIESRTDNTLYGEDSEREVALARMRGWTRLKLCPGLQGTAVENIALDKFAEYLDEHRLPATQIADIVVDTLGIEVAEQLVPLLKSPNWFGLRVAERIFQLRGAIAPGQSRSIAFAVQNSPACRGAIHRLLRLGLEPQQVLTISLSDARENLIRLTRQVMGERIEFEPEPVYEWLDACALLAHLDHIGLSAAEALLAGEGWYRCWLRFCIVLVRAEAAPSSNQASGAIAALKELTLDMRPFAGDPRACDLYRLHGAIKGTLKRALRLLADEHWQDAVKILRQVSCETGTTLFGELGGPISADTLLELVVRFSTPARAGANESIIRETIEHETSRAYYTDIARFQLFASRLALASSDLSTATKYWELACQNLAAYGFRKDATIFELLDSLDELVAGDIEATRVRVRELQPLCERVLLHTDRKGTRHARSRWWKLLASSDPIVQSSLVAQQLLARCNRPSDVLEDARADLWRAHATRSNPTLSIALRITLEKGLEEEDVAVLERLRGSSLSAMTKQRLALLLVARADDRPASYSYSNSNELLSSDWKLVEQCNAIAEALELPPVLPTPSGDRESRPPEEILGARNLDSERLKELFDDQFSMELDLGAQAISGIARTWKTRPYKAKHFRWAKDRFANAVGYRVVSLLQNERIDEAEKELSAIASSVSYSGEDSLLGAVGEGLERYGFLKQAVFAYTLHWTRTRGGGGWHCFGGTTNIGSLQRAATLDPLLTLRLLMAEVERVVRNRAGTIGMTQSLVIAFGLVDWGASTDQLESRPSRGTAFQAWDEAARVIASRMPRVGGDDDPDSPYIPSDDNEVAGSQVDVAFSFAIVSALSHPSRERKRRALLAVREALSAKPDLVGDAVSFALGHLDDPVTTGWLLAVVEGSSEKIQLAARCREQLSKLSMNPYLEVRTRARGLLRSIGVTTELPPPAEPTTELEKGRIKIWLNQEGDVQPSDELEKEADDSLNRARYFLNRTAGVRLSLVEEQMPTLAFAAECELARDMNLDTYKHCLKSQLDSLTSRVDFREPNAFIAPFETAERVLQRLAGAYRTVSALKGQILTDPMQWEGEIARLLSNDSRFQLAFESSRVPRPNYPTPPGYSDPFWSRARSASKLETLSSDLIAVRYDDSHVSATTRLSASTTAPTCSDPRYVDWRVVAILESRIAKSSSGVTAKTALVTRCAAVEYRRGNSLIALDKAPIGIGALQTWVDIPSNGTPPVRNPSPLIVADTESSYAADGSSGLGFSGKPLALSWRLVDMLGLRPSPELLKLEDHRGEIAVVARVWRTAYQVSDYEMEWPVLSGSDILIRPDKFYELEAALGLAVVWREYVEGSFQTESASD